MELTVKDWVLGVGLPRRSEVSPERKARRQAFERTRLEKIETNLVSDERVPHKVSRSKYSPNQCRYLGKR